MSSAPRRAPRRHHVSAEAGAGGRPRWFAAEAALGRRPNPHGAAGTPRSHRSHRREASSAVQVETATVVRRRGRTRPKAESARRCWHHVRTVRTGERPAVPCDEQGVNAHTGWDRPRYRGLVSRRTKIIATIGPASDSPAVLQGLVEAGMDVARLGLAHDSMDTQVAR
ncbi:hypothetical protein B7486_65225, partial [cyanobacterium TDX16]